MSVLQVKFSCRACRIEDQVVTVRHRKEGENVLSWMEDVQRQVSNTHRRLKPDCWSAECDLKIPYQHQDKPVGCVGSHD